MADFTINYFHADNATGASLRGHKDYTVWFHVPGSSVLVEGTDDDPIPKNAAFAVIGSLASSVTGAKLGGSIVRKDPTPPPPPPPRVASTARATYFDDASVVNFIGAVDRGLE